MGKRSLGLRPQAVPSPVTLTEWAAGPSCALILFEIKEEPLPTVI